MLEDIKEAINILVLTVETMYELKLQNDGKLQEA